MGGAGGKETAADADAASAASEAVAARPYPLHTAGGQPVAVVHVVAELAPRTGEAGEAVANLQAQSRAGLAVSLIMPLYRQVRARS
jgi:hypothetical protein